MMGKYPLIIGLILSSVKILLSIPIELGSNIIVNASIIIFTKTKATSNRFTACSTVRFYLKHFMTILGWPPGS